MSSVEAQAVRQSGSFRIAGLTKYNSGLYVRFLLCLHPGGRSAADRVQKGRLGPEGWIMEDLFRDYWWLMFPMAWFALALINAIRGEPNASRTIRATNAQLGADRELR
ncbi:MAG: hypothetical protein M0D54_15795 [Hyphomonadaceae bacterium JAD_PAG50586_4]|nr:MAG: hypothetical protein M0D54_15795 [Hyphomonadaceae bacterium JAD_PAG50586_4]